MRVTRPYVITGTTVVDQPNSRSSTSLTREAIMLEIAMRRCIEGDSARRAWEAAVNFVEEMDRRLPYEEPPAPITGKPLVEILTGTGEKSA